MYSMSTAEQLVARADAVELEEATHLLRRSSAAHRLSIQFAKHCGHGARYPALLKFGLASLRMFLRANGYRPGELSRPAFNSDPGRGWLGFCCCANIALIAMERIS
jgi:hypothetical protein